MEQGQQRFFDFIMDRVDKGKQANAEALLEDSFSKQAGGAIDSEYLNGFNPRLLALVKPECVEEVRSILMGFSAQQNSN